MSWIEDPGTQYFEGLNLRDLKVDQSYVRISSSNPAWLYSLSEECYKCPYLRREELFSDKVLTLSSKHRETWRLYPSGGLETIPVSNTSGLLCQVNAELGEFGVYDLTVPAFDNEDLPCRLTTAKEPVNIYMPLLITFIGFLAAILLWIVVKQMKAMVRKRAKKRYIIPTSQLSSLDIPTPEPEPDLDLVQTPPPRQRLRSLDTFRGISIVLMVFVNYGAGQYWFLEHATWNGLQMADLLFPWFMWIMGVCIPISVRSQMKKNVSRCAILRSVLRRSTILFALGVILNTVGVGSDLNKIRVFGVLQRFGICYLILATLSTLLTSRSVATPKWKICAELQDFVVSLPQWLIVGAATAGYTVLILMLEVPGCPLGYLGPGGIQDNSRYQECRGGVTGYLDKLILGNDHIYKWPTAAEVYGEGAFDPEGLIGCLPSLLQVMFGVQAGMILTIHKSVYGRSSRWIAWGIMTGVGGGVLCLASKEDGWIPVNKNLWSLSYVLVTSCFAFFLLTFLYLLIDVKKWWSGAPFFYPGMNSTIIYVGHSLAYDLFPWHWAYGPMNTHFLLLMESLWGTALWVVVGYWLYLSNFFLSV